AAEKTPGRAPGEKGEAVGEKSRERAGEKGPDSPSTARKKKKSDDILSQLLATAATNARSDKELAASLEKLRQLGMQMQTADAFRVLGRALPAWNVALPAAEAAESTGSVTRNSASAAIRRIVTLPEDPAEVSKRFHEMLLAAVEQFNKGSL